MRLHYFKIKGFRRINDATIHYGDATFLIGENNTGKRSVLGVEPLYIQESRLHSSFNITQNYLAKFPDQKKKHNSQIFLDT